MIKQIPFDPALARKAWKLPQNGGKFYLLFQRNGFPVLPIHYARRYYVLFPFIGKVWRFHPVMKSMDLTTGSWSKDGTFMSDGTHDDDLFLYEGEIETAGGRAKRGEK